MIWPLILTIFLEFFPVCLLRRNKDPIGRVAFAVVAINLATNPLANSLFPRFSFVEIETGVVLAETLLFSAVFGSKIREGFAISLCANLVSMIAGIALAYLGFNPGF